MRAHWLGIGLAIASLACTGEEDTGKVAPPGTSADCGDTNPVIEALSIEDGGVYEFEQDVFYPSILIKADITDEDGDLTYYTMRVWHDEVVDGRVLAEGDYQEVYGTLGSDDCGVPSATVTMRMAITGSGKSPSYSTDTEFGVVIFDEAENKSDDGEPLEEAFFTPDADGNYPT